MTAADDVVARTDRTLLRAWRLDEADRCFDIHRRREVAQWIGGRPMQERAEAVALIESSAARLAAEPRYGSWAIVERAGGIPAGSVILKPLPNGEGEIEIGWHLHPDRWGHGLATEAARAVLARAWRGGLEEIWAVTHLDNDRSIGVCLKLGLRLLGVTDRWYDEPSLMWWIGRDPRRSPSIAPDRPAPIEIAPTPSRSAAAERITRAFLEEVVGRYHGRPATTAEVVDELAHADDEGPPALLLLATVSETPLGCAGLRLPQPGLGEVTRVYVHPAARRQRLGTRLMEALESAGRTRGLHTLRLDTREDLVESRRLYERLGYAPTAPFNDSPYTDHRLAKRL